jgi:antitoxin (DNA-binding transcriptional repressor) of toxin-antitoxin stability system
VVIARAGKPIARLVPIEAAPRPKLLGLLAGQIEVPEDFDAPLPADVIADFEGR